MSHVHINLSKVDYNASDRSIKLPIHVQFTTEVHMVYVYVCVIIITCHKIYINRIKY